MVVNNNAFFDRPVSTELFYLGAKSPIILQPLAARPWGTSIKDALLGIVLFREVVQTLTNNRSLGRQFSEVVATGHRYAISFTHAVFLPR